jgi:hypothetical protein
LYYSTNLFSRGNYFYTALTYSYFNIVLKKSNNSDLKLSTNYFEEVFNISTKVNDTLVFKKSKITNCIKNDCMQELHWSTKFGIVKIVLINGTIWKP